MGQLNWRPPRSLNTAHWRAWPGALIGSFLLFVLLRGSCGVLRGRDRIWPPSTESRQTHPTRRSVRGRFSRRQVVAYSDPTGLYLRQISNGETHRWDLPKDFVACPNSWFPDGAHLLVTRCEGADQVPGLWKLSLLTGTHSNSWTTQPPDWFLRTAPVSPICQNYRQAANSG